MDVKVIFPKIVNGLRQWMINFCTFTPLIKIDKITPSKIKPLVEDLDAKGLYINKKYPKFLSNK